MSAAPERPPDLQQFLDLLSGIRGPVDLTALQDLWTHIRSTARIRMSPLDTLRRSLDSEDLTQEALFDLVRNVGYFRGATWAEFYAFLEALLQRRKSDLARHHNRMRRNGAGRVIPMEPLDLPDRGRSPESQALEAEDLLRLRRLVDALPPESAAIIRLRMQGLDHEEIATRLSITTVAARKRLSRAIAELRCGWNEHGGS